jgi:hypothetical protein
MPLRLPRRLRRDVHAPPTPLPVRALCSLQRSAPEAGCCCHRHWPLAHLPRLPPPLLAGIVAGAPAGAAVSASAHAGAVGGPLPRTLSLCGRQSKKNSVASTRGMSSPRQKLVDRK